MQIEINDYTKTIRSAVILDRVTLRFESGSIFGLNGPNGSGKTMLMRAICGLIYPTEGYVNIDGQVIGKDTSFPPSVGILIENPAFIAKYTGLKNLLTLASLKGVIGENEVRTTLSAVGLDPDDKRPYRKYSLGMKQRLGIAAALMENPELILLDEPINALDEDGVRLVRDLLFEYKARGALIVVACHDFDELRFLSDEIIEMYEGKVTRRYQVTDDGH
jgi:ABC-2 type transport system ATP-binding protein